MEPDTGEKEGKDMKRKIIYTDAPRNISRNLKDGKRVVDFLPPPEKLLRNDPKIKITITLNSGNVEFFKKHAQKNNVKYQTMINEVLDKYVQAYSR